MVGSAFCDGLLPAWPYQSTSNVVSDDFTATTARVIAEPIYNPEKTTRRGGAIRLSSLTPALAVMHFMAVMLFTVAPE